MTPAAAPPLDFEAVAKQIVGYCGLNHVHQREHYIRWVKDVIEKAWTAAQAKGRTAPAAADAHSRARLLADELYNFRDAGGSAESVAEAIADLLYDALPPSPAPLPATEDIAGYLFFIPYERKNGSWDMGGPFLDRAEAEKYRARDYKHVNAGVVIARARDVANTLSALRAAGQAVKP